MNVHEIAQILDEIAFLLEIQGENAFKVRAYHNGARALESLDEDLSLLIEEERLEEVPDIGAGIAEKIATLFQTGKLPYYEKLRKQVPAGLLELLHVQGLGAKKVKRLYDELKIRNLEQLTKACEQGKVAKLEGFGKKTEENILKNIDQLQAYRQRMLWWDACAHALPMEEALAKLGHVQQVAVAGSFRRKCETVGDLDFLVASAHPKEIMQWFISQPSVETVQSHGATKSSVRLKGGLQADLRVVPQNEYGPALLYFTGSKEFSILLRKRAQQMGYTLNEYGLTPQKGKKVITGKSEEAMFKALKLAYIPPELRESEEAIEAAEKGKLPKLVHPEDIRGVFHCHTTASDGHNTLEEMAQAAEALGWEYLGIADHSKSSVQANGLDEKRLLEQIEQIDKLNQTLKIHLFAGVECDILKEGRLDFSDDILKQLDYVVASVHSSFQLSEAAMTKRLIKAIENPYVTILGHVSGRLLLRREPYALNLPKVIDACIANETYMELNAHPMRLDMGWRFWHKAAEKGLQCCINPDAHRTSDLDYYLAGINSARKGWLEKSHILNTCTLAQVKKRL